MGYRTTFYFETYDGKQHDFHTQHCYRPAGTKAWSILKRMLNGRDDIRGIAWRLDDERYVKQSNEKS